MDETPSVLKHRLLLGLGAFFGALLIAELWFRARQATGWEFLLADTPSLYDLSIFQPDDELGQVLRPGSKGITRTAEFSSTVHVNDLGIRGRPLGPKPNGELRILAVGDSFTLGLQVDEDKTFSSIASDLLSERTGRTVRLMNVGVDGFGTQASTGLVERMAEATEADAALLTFFLGNDFWDNQNFEQVLQHPPLVQKNRPTLGLGRVSALYTYVRLALAMRRASKDPEVLHRRQAELSVFNDPGALARTRPATQEALAGFMAVCESRGIVPLVAIAPPAFAIDETRAQATLEYFGLDAAQLDLAAPAATVAQVAPEGLSIVDLGPSLRAEAAEQTLYFTLDGHWTAAGHRVAAETLSAFLAPLLTQE